MKLTKSGKIDRRSISSVENGRKYGGRHKSAATLAAQKARDYIAKRVEKELKPIVDTAIGQAIKGDKYAREWLSNYAWGKPTTIIVTEDEEGNRREIQGNTIIFANQDADSTSGQ